MKTWKCPNCRAPNLVGSPLCMGCGTVIPHQGGSTPTESNETLPAGPLITTAQGARPGVPRPRSGWGEGATPRTVFRFALATSAIGLFFAMLHIHGAQPNPVPGGVIFAPGQASHSLNLPPMLGGLPRNAAAGAQSLEQQVKSRLESQIPGSVVGVAVYGRSIDAGYLVALVDTGRVPEVPPSSGDVLTAFAAGSNLHVDPAAIVNRELNGVTSSCAHVDDPNIHVVCAWTEGSVRGFLLSAEGTSPKALLDVTAHAARATSG